MYGFAQNQNLQIMTKVRTLESSFILKDIARWFCALISII